MFQAATMETVLYLLDDVDLPSSPAKKTSRELSGLVLEQKYKKNNFKNVLYFRNFKKSEKSGASLRSP